MKTTFGRRTRVLAATTATAGLVLVAGCSSGDDGGSGTKTAAGGVRTLELMDVAMATYTPDYTAEEPVLDYAAAHGKGVILKKVLSSGHAADVPAALRFAFAHPGTGCAIVGTINPDHLRQLAAGVTDAVRHREPGSKP